VASPFIIGAVIAFLLDIPTRYLETRAFARFKASRGLAIAASYAFALMSLLFLFLMIVPQLFNSIISLLGNVHQYVEILNELLDWVWAQFSLEESSLDQFLLSYEDLVNQFLILIRNLLPDLPGISMRIGNAVITFLTSTIVSVYMLVSKRKLLGQCRRVMYAFMPRRGADAVARVMRMSAQVFSGFIGAKIIDSAVIGLLCFFGMSLMAVFIDVPYIPLISVVIGVTNIIPFFGPFIGAIPSGMILLMVNPMSALWFTVFVVVLQQFDGNFLGPKILGGSPGLPALWVLVAIVVGGGLFGFPGMVAGVPTAAVLYSLLSEAVRARLEKKRLDGDGDSGGAADGSGADGGSGDGGGAGDSGGNGGSGDGRSDAATVGADGSGVAGAAIAASSEAAGGADTANSSTTGSGAGV
jgi:predicted PurR-regulated permease PerM